ncbi:MAG: YceI family protein [Actinomycetota bacterium]|nr:YceI family protein [Actinomycetota bacterium]
MALAPGTHKLGPDSGKLEVRTYRDGIAQKVGHDLIMDVGTWEGTVEVGGDGQPTSVTLQADGSSLQVREGTGGVKPLSDKDKGDIRKSMDEKVLLGQPISFRSSAVETAGGLTVRGELTIVGNERPESFELELADDGRLTGTLPIVQSEFGIKPYKAMMGALKVKDAVEIVLDVRLPVG